MKDLLKIVLDTNQRGGTQVVSVRMSTRQLVQLDKVVEITGGSRTQLINKILATGLKELGEHFDGK